MHNSFSQGRKIEPCSVTSQKALLKRTSFWWWLSLCFILFFKCLHFTRTGWKMPTVLSFVMLWIQCWPNSIHHLNTWGMNTLCLFINRHVFMTRKVFPRCLSYVPRWRGNIPVLWGVKPIWSLMTEFGFEFFFFFTFSKKSLQPGLETISAQ